MKHFNVLITLLRDRSTFLEEIRRNIKVEKKIGSLLIASSAFFAVYGAIIGSSSTWLQTIASAIKLPALYLITLVICLPTLYFFDILFGSALTFLQYAALLLTTVSIISVLLFSFSPVILFFLISIHDYHFFLLLNVTIFALTGFVGVKLFYEGMLAVTRMNQAPLVREPIRAIESTGDLVPVMDAPIAQVEVPVETSQALQKTRVRLLQFWLVLYALVGSQLGWTLRPFFGSPNEPFQLFRNIEGNFYLQIFRSIQQLLGQ